MSASNQAELFVPEQGDLIRTAMMDPPWEERGGGRIKRGADRHYPLMKTEDIPKTIIDTEEWKRISPSAHLWIWVTNNFLQDGLWVMKELGFRYITNSAWIKMRNGKLQIGLGQYLRGSHELMLFGRRGNITMKPIVAPPSVFFAERTKHSKKPEESYKLIETVSPGKYVEFFARSLRSGWIYWGNEV